MRLEGRNVRLRAVEPRDIEVMYRWENDVELWTVSGTTEPFSHEQMARFVERQLEGDDLLRSGQLRLIIEVCREDRTERKGREDREGREDRTEGAVVRNAGKAAQDDGEAVRDEGAAMQNDGEAAWEGEAVGAVDLFEYDPIHRRAGIGILIYGARNRRQGYAREALGILCRYARERLNLHQLWCTVGVDNTASLGLFRAAGFVETGTRRDWIWTPGGFHDVIFFQKMLEEQ